MAAGGGTGEEPQLAGAELRVSGEESRSSGAEPGSLYRKLREDCLNQGQLFEDPDFPTTERSLRRDGTVRPGIRWRRPWEIVSRPRFVIEEATRFDLDQGDLGNNWFIAAAGCLAVSNKKLFERCIPPDQSFEVNYAGIFYFRFWHFDSWVEVVVDDRLPTVRGRLTYARNREQPNEFWIALLEKAYAKLYGCYENLSGGFIMDALVDFTGGISEYISLKRAADVPPNLYDLMWKTARMNSMMGASIEYETEAREEEASISERGTAVGGEGGRGEETTEEEGKKEEEESKARREEPMQNGLFRGHSYSITSLARLRVNTREVCLLRLRNPWGRDQWSGAWSDRSREWRSISDEDKVKIGLVPREDGEFWICYEDFLAFFTDLDFCHLYPDAYTQEIATDMNKQGWEVMSHRGEWVRGFNAGGCGNAPDQDLFWTNPQFQIEVSEADDENGDGFCTVVIALMQKTLDMRHDLSISYQLFRVKDGVAPLPDGSNYDKEDLGVRLSASRYTNLRERTGRHLLAPGSYVIIPTTFLPNKEGRFYLRVFTEKAAQSRVVDVPTHPGKDLTVDDRIETLFTKYAGDDGRIYAEELQEAINETRGDEGDKVGIETARSLLAMHDLEEVGYIQLKDFRGLIKDYNLWQTAFRTFDREGNGFIDTFDLPKLFGAIGFSVSRQVQSAVVRRYGGRKRQLELEDFVHIMCKLYAMYNQFIQRKSVNERIILDLETWLALNMFY